MRRYSGTAPEPRYNALGRARVARMVSNRKLKLRQYICSAPLEWPLFFQLASANHTERVRRTKFKFAPSFDTLFIHSSFELIPSSVELLMLGKNNLRGIFFRMASVLLL